MIRLRQKASPDAVGGGFTHSEGGDWLAVLRIAGAVLVVGIAINWIHIAVVAGNF